MNIRVKRGNKANLPASAPSGTFLWCEDTKELYMGTGTGVQLINSTNGGTSTMGSIAVLQYQSGTSPTFANNTISNHILNTSVLNEISGLSLNTTSGLITIPAGIYKYNYKMVVGGTAAPNFIEHWLYNNSQSKMLIPAALFKVDTTQLNLLIEREGIFDVASSTGVYLRLRPFSSISTAPKRETTDVFAEVILEKVR